ncbi:MAG: SdpI family protein [Planctomycetales bacterium]
MQPTLAPEQESATPSLSRFLLPPLVFSFVMTLALTTVSAFVWMQLPADARVPMHWNIHGQPDQYAGPVSLFLMPAVVLGITLLLSVIPFAEPRRQNLLLSWKAYRAIWISVVLLLFAMGVGIDITALGYKVPIDRIAMIGVGVLFMVIGNMLGKLRSTFFVGVRTPWTLSSETCWNKTNRLTGRLFFVGGAAILALTLTGMSGPVLLLTQMVFIGFLIATVLGYSWYTWSRDPNRSC